MSYHSLPMTGFEPWSSGVRNDRSTNLTTNTARQTLNWHLTQTMSVLIWQTGQTDDWAWITQMRAAAVVVRGGLSVTRWLDYISIFSHIKQRKFAHVLIKCAKVDSKVYQ